MNCFMRSVLCLILAAGAPLQALIPTMRGAIQDLTKQIAAGDITGSDIITQIKALNLRPADEAEGIVENLNAEAVTALQKENYPGVKATTNLVQEIRSNKIKAPQVPKAPPVPTSKVPEITQPRVEPQISQPQPQQQPQAQQPFTQPFTYTPLETSKPEVKQPQPQQQTQVQQPQLSVEVQGLIAWYVNKSYASIDDLLTFIQFASNQKLKKTDYYNGKSSEYIMKDLQKVNIKNLDTAWFTSTGTGELSLTKLFEDYSTWKQAQFYLKKLDAQKELAQVNDYLKKFLGTQIGTTYIVNIIDDFTKSYEQKSLQKPTSQQQQQSQQPTIQVVDPDVERYLTKNYIIKQAEDLYFKISAILWYKHPYKDDFSTPGVVKNLDIQSLAEEFGKILAFNKNVDFARLESDNILQSYYLIKLGLSHIAAYETNNKPRTDYKQQITLANAQLKDLLSAYVKAEKKFGWQIIEEFEKEKFMQPQQQPKPEAKQPQQQQQSFLPTFERGPLDAPKSQPKPEVKQPQQQQPQVQPQPKSGAQQQPLQGLGDLSTMVDQRIQNSLGSSLEAVYNKLSGTRKKLKKDFEGKKGFEGIASYATPLGIEFYIIKKPADVITNLDKIFAELTSRYADGIPFDRVALVIMDYYDLVMYLLQIQGDKQDYINKLKAILKLPIIDQNKLLVEYMFDNGY